MKEFFQNVLATFLTVFSIIFWFPLAFIYYFSYRKSLKTGTIKVTDKNGKGQIKHATAVNILSYFLIAATAFNEQTFFKDDIQVPEDFNSSETWAFIFIIIKSKM